MEKNMNVGLDKEFLDETGKKATMHIEPVDGYKVNSFKNGSFKLVNYKKNNNVLGENKKENIFTRDIGFKTKGTGLFTREIGVKSSGFAQVASLSVIVALAGLFVMYIFFRY